MVKYLLSWSKVLPAPPRRQVIHGGGRFVEEQPLGVVEHPVQQALQPPRDAAEIDWGAHHQAVGLDDLLDALIDAVIVENTAALAQQDLQSIHPRMG